MKKQNGSKQSMVVLEVVCVKASSGEASGVDTDAINFLQETGFQSIKVGESGDNHVCAQAPGNHTIFLLEYDKSQSSVSVPFRLVRVSQGVRTIIDSGHTFYIQGEPNDDETIEINSIGDGIRDWTIICKEASSGVLELNDRLRQQADGATKVRGLRQLAALSRVQHPPSETKALRTNAPIVSIEKEISVASSTTQHPLYGTKVLRTKAPITRVEKDILAALSRIRYPQVPSVTTVANDSKSVGVPGKEPGNSSPELKGAPLIQCRLDNLFAVLMELNALELDEWRKYAALKGCQHVSSEMSRLTEAGLIIIEIKSRMSRARAAVKSSFSETAS